MMPTRRRYNPYEPIRVKLALSVFLLLVILSLLTGCRSSRTITIEQTPASAVNTLTDTSFVQAPKLVAMPRAGMRLSFPESVRLYSARAHGHAFEVIEIAVDHEALIVRTPTSETRHRLPHRGETKTIRNEADSSAVPRIIEYVEGEPKPERTSVQMPAEESVLDKLTSVLMWSVLLVVLVLILAATLPRLIAR